MKVAPYRFFANTTAPTVPARLGIQTHLGPQRRRPLLHARRSSPPATSTRRQAAPTAATTRTTRSINPLCIDVRSGGYFPADLRGLYDITGHGFDGTGQTIGFTLWTVPERQAAMTTFATDTGDQLITVDPSCIATGNSPTDAELVHDADGRGRPPAVHPREREHRHDQQLRLERRDGARHRGGPRRRDARRHEVLRLRVRHRPRRRTPASPTPAATAPTSAWRWRWRTPPTTRRCTASRTAGRYGGEAEWGVTDPFVRRHREHPRARARRPGRPSTSRPATPARTSPATRRDSPYVVAVGGTSTYSTSDSGHVEHEHDVERRRQLVLEHHRPAVVADRAPASRPTRRARAASSRTSRRSPTRTRVSASPRSTNLTGGTSERPGRRHEPRGAGDERPPGRDPELHRRADLPGPDAADGLRRSGAVPARQQPQLRELLPRHRVRQHRQPDERPRRRRRDQGLGRGDRLGRARLVQLRDRLRDARSARRT